jgi:homoprotocatechuate degradation regulator HpaR
MAKRSPQLRQTTRSLPIALLRARETVMAPYREMLAKSKISEQKWRVLRVVSESGPMEQTAISEAACLLLPSLTRILSALEKDGFLVRAPGHDDRRKSIVQITEAGQDLIKAHTPDSEEISKRLEDRFGSENLDNLLGLLDRLDKLDLFK